jgi:hypothetical protein
MPAFVRLTLLVAAALTAVFLLFLVIKVLAAALILAAVLVGLFLAINFVRGFFRANRRRLTGNAVRMP